jgi:hypothetical protein
MHSVHGHTHMPYLLGRYISWHGSAQANHYVIIGKLVPDVKQHQLSTKKQGNNEMSSDYYCFLGDSLYFLEMEDVCLLLMLMCCDGWLRWLVLVICGSGEKVGGVDGPIVLPTTSVHLQCPIFSLWLDHSTGALLFISAIIFSFFQRVMYLYVFCSA